LKRAAVAAILIAIPILALGLVVNAFRGPMESTGGVILVRHGIGARGVANELVARGILSRPRLFLLAARLAKVDRRLQAGRYAIPPNTSIASLLELLRAGPNVRETVTIPEGSRDDQIAGALERAAEVDSAAFLAIVRNASSPARFHVPGPTLQGYLFPETYEIPWGISAEEAVGILVEQYHAVVTREMMARAESLGLGERGLVTLASIIEAETPVPEERPRVSAVFHNRLRAGWNLEADPTVRYATGNEAEEISVHDLVFDSPYNTYRYPGLPPGPIGNPGRASLMAALFPVEGSEEFFFVASGDGGHVFSTTARDHARAVAAYRKRNAGSGQP
jgi:UPF0755 protein